MIRKIKSGYRIYSKHAHRNLGTFKTREQAERRLRQIEYFKYLK